MIKLTIGNSYSKIEGLTTQPFAALRKELSYQIDSQAAYFSKNHFNTTRYCIDKKGEFPTGLLPRVYKFLHDNNLHVQIDTAVQKKLITVDHKPRFDKTPRNAQKDAVEAAIKAKRSTLSLPTGSGKSFVIALLIAKLKLRTLVVVPNLELKRQLTEDFNKQFGTLLNIGIMNIDSPELEKAKDYDLLIIDEAHHVAAKTYQKLNRKVWGPIQYRVFLTATPFRNNTEENLLFEGIAGQVSYRLTYQQAVDQGMIVPVEAFYIDVPKQPTDAYTWAQVYSQLVVNNDLRNHTIVRYLHTLDLCTLCLVKEVKHGQILSDLSGIPFANGADDDSRQYITDFAKGLIPKLIATEGLFGEGIDSKACEVVIIAGLGKAKSAFMQKVGRSVRRFGNKESGKVILIRDTSHKFTQRHYNEQKKILLEEYGVECLKLP